MTPEPDVPPAHAWWLEPRDPLVFGDGSRVPALAPRHRFLLPPQGTLAGMVRTRLVAGQADVSKDDARRLLDVRIRGPWLARARGAGEAPELWLPVPADVMAVTEGDDESYLDSQILPLGADQGTLWPAGGPAPGALFRRADRLEGGAKTSRPRFPFWPFDQIVRWNLQAGTGQTARRRSCRPIAPEYRVHVAIEDETWTAEPEALFSSAGLRYGTRFGIAAEVADRRGAPVAPGPDPGTPPHLLVLGAEARTVSCTVLPGLCFPSFDGPAVSWRAEKRECETSFRDLYRGRVEELLQEGHGIGLRLQLLTPGAFGGWQPRWPEELDGKLLAACLERFVPVSGWDLQARGPRRVQRLVPAGSVYLLGPFDGKDGAGTLEKVIDLCSRWWGRSLCEGQEGNESSFLAPPSHDGYGLVLPAPCAFPRSLP